MKPGSPSTWEELCALVDRSITEARSRLDAALHKRELDNFRQVKEKIENCNKKGMVFSSGTRLREIEKQLDERKYENARRSIDSVDHELVRTLSLFNRVTSTLREIRKLRDNIAGRGIRTDEGEIERLDGMYGKGEYLSLLKILPVVKKGMNAVLQRFGPVPCLTIAPRLSDNSLLLRSAANSVDRVGKAKISST